jgi:glycosyltransferase involved in cell wall biosynthesis
MELKFMSLIWLLGPIENLNDGVGKYSRSLIDELSKLNSMGVIVKSIPYKPRSIMRYIYQFFIYPIVLIKLRNNYSLVVLSQENFAFLLPFIKLIGRKSIIIYHHSPDQNTAVSAVEKLKILYLNVTAIFLRLANQIICPSKDASEQIIKNMNLSNEKVSIVYNSFDFNYSCKSEEKAVFLSKLGIDYKGHERIILNIGTDETRKNLFCFLQGFSELDQSSYIFIKAGKVIVEGNNMMMENLVSDKCLNVKFLSYVSDIELNSLYELADVYVSPSLHEGFGRTVIESQAHGTPILASKLPVYDEIMTNSYVSVDCYTQAVAWREALEKFNFSNDELIKLGRSNARRFSAETVACDFLAIIKKVKSGEL